MGENGLDGMSKLLRGDIRLSKSRSRRRLVSFKQASSEPDGQDFKMLGGTGVAEMSAIGPVFCLEMGSGEGERVEKGEAKKAWVLEADEGGGEGKEKYEDTSENVEDSDDDDVLSDGRRERGGLAVPGDSEGAACIGANVDRTSAVLFFSCHVLSTHHTYSVLPFFPPRSPPASHRAENNRNPTLVLIAPV